MKNKLMSLIVAICLILTVYPTFPSVYGLSYDNEQDLLPATVSFDDMEADAKATIEYLFPKNTKYVKMVDPALVEDIETPSDISQLDRIKEFLLPNQAELLTSKKNVYVEYTIYDERYDKENRIIDFTADIALIDAESLQKYTYTKVVDVSVEYMPPDIGILSLIRNFKAEGNFTKVNALAETLVQTQNIGVNAITYYNSYNSDKSINIFDFSDIEDAGAEVKKTGRGAGDPYWQTEEIGVYYQDTLYIRDNIEFYGLNIISADKNDTPQKIIDKIRTEINAFYNNSEYNIVVEKFDEIDGKIDNIDEVTELSAPYIAYKNQAGYGEATDNIYYFGIEHKSDPSQFGWSFVSVVEEQIDVPDLPDAIEPVKNLFGSAGKIRINGNNRYETSMKAADGIKKSLAVDKFNTIIVACGDDYADALSGSYLAKKKNAPILLVDDAYEAAIKEYIYANVKAGGTVYLLGGTGAVSQAFEKSLHDYNVKRLGGADRYETNLKILDEAGIEGDKILLCSAWSFADSLSASATGNPILLVGNSLNKKQAALLKSFEPKKYYIIGGEGAVNYDVEKTLRKYGKVERVSGLNRYETSVAVANEFFDYGADAGVLAYGENFPDGLSAGPLALSISAPLILVSDSDIAYAAKYFGNMGIKRAAALGGESLISDSSIDSILY